MPRKKPATPTPGLLITRKVTLDEILHPETGAYYRTTRESQGLSLREMARRTGLSHTFLHDLEHGRRQWTQDLADTVTAALGKGKGVSEKGKGTDQDNSTPP